MSWARGFFRLWILFAVMWVALCATYAALNPQQTHVYEVLDHNSEKFQVEALEGRSLEEIAAYASTAAGAKWDRPECAPKKRGPWCEYGCYAS